MWKNLYLFFCFLESANNVREPNNSPARDKKREKRLDMQKWREKGNKSMGIECVYVWGVLMWKNLYLFFCFLESANNVRTKQSSPQRQKAREAS